VLIGNNGWRDMRGSPSPAQLSDATSQGARAQLCVQCACTGRSQRQKKIQVRPLPPPGGDQLVECVLCLWLEWPSARMSSEGALTTNDVWYLDSAHIGAR
jgi:hypothetical protein